MHRIILDKSIIIKYPQLLTFNNNSIYLVVTVDVLQELLDIKPTRWGHKLADIIEKASLDGGLTLMNPFTPIYRSMEQMFLNSVLSFADVSLLAAAEVEKINYPNDQISIATHDQELIKYARKNGIRILTDSEVSALLVKSPDDQDPQRMERLKAVESLGRAKRKSFTLSFVFAIISVLILFMGIKDDILKNATELLGQNAKYFLVPLLVFFGAFFYYCRERFRLYYGMFEFWGGAAVIWLVFSQNGYQGKEVLRSIELDFKILGGLYIIVRGMDNIHKGLAGTRMGLWFDKIFQEKKQQIK